jgi:hypothetical protein
VITTAAILSIINITITIVITMVTETEASGGRGRIVTLLDLIRGGTMANVRLTTGPG